MSDLGRFILFVVQPFRRSPDVLDGWTFASAVGDFSLSGTPAFAIWKYVDAEQGNFLARLAQVSAVVLFIGVAWAGFRLMRIVSAHEHPTLTVSHAPDHDIHGMDHDTTGMPTVEILLRRIARLEVRTSGGDIGQVRLNLLRFTPQGNTGPVPLRERYDQPPYTQSRIAGYPVQVGAPAVFDFVSLGNPKLQHNPGDKKYINIHYAAQSEFEPNPIEANCRYFFEVQALGAGARSDPTTFFAEMDQKGDLVSGPAAWPTPVVP